MNQEIQSPQPAPVVDLRKIAEQAGIRMNLWNQGAASMAYSDGCEGVTREHLERFAALYGFACWNAALAANPPNMQSFVRGALDSAFPAPEGAQADAMTKALAVLERVQMEVMLEDQMPAFGLVDAIRSLRAALAAPAPQAPVAWVDERAIAWLAGRRDTACITTQLQAGRSPERPMPLYAAPQTKEQP